MVWQALKALVMQDAPLQWMYTQQWIFICFRWDETFNFFSDWFRHLVHHDQRQNKSKILQIKVFRTLQVNFNQIGLLFTDWADFYSFWWPFFTLATCHFKQIFEQPIKINPILAGWGLTGDRFGSGHLFGGWMIDWSFYRIHGSHFSLSNRPIKNWFGVGILGFSRIGRLFSISLATLYQIATVSIFIIDSGDLNTEHIWYLNAE